MNLEFGDKMVCYADSNGSYDVAEGITFGRLLEEYKFAFYEEPVPFDWYEETKAVTDAVNIPVAGGEQEASMHAFRWLIANDGLDIVQPDLFVGRDQRVPVCVLVERRHRPLRRPGRKPLLQALHG